MPNIAVVMAVYQPDPGFLQQQLASIAEQTLPPQQIFAVIADQTSAALVYDLAGGVGLRVELVEPTTPLSAVDAFELGLQTALGNPSITAIALSDQDDIWHPEKLETCWEVMARTQADMVHSDARVVDAGGAVMHGSLFRRERRQTAPGLRDLLYRNTVTGMTCLMRRSLLDRALPFPRQDGTHFYHDLWLALIARAGRGLAFCPKTLVDYRQHGGNAVGVLGKSDGMVSLRARVAEYGLARFLAESVTARATKADGLSPFCQSRSWGGAFLWDAARFLATGRIQHAKKAATWCGITIGRRIWALKETLRLSGYRAQQYLSLIHI